MLHLGYFWGTAYWEAGILRSALGAFDEAPQSRHNNPLDHRVALRFLVLKVFLLPAALVGTAILVTPGFTLWLARARHSFSSSRDGPDPGRRWGSAIR